MAFISKDYNGWSAGIRNYRGARFYSLLRKKALPPAVKCELCGSTKGLTFHAEEYGSTWWSYLQSCHALCCVCHATMHVRHKYPNRWTRFVRDTLEETRPDFPYTSMSQVYGVYRGVKDIEEPVEVPTGDHWLLQLIAAQYVGEEKVALKEEGGILLPDFACYPVGTTEISGVTFDQKTQIVTPYNWSAHE